MKRITLSLLVALCVPFAASAQAPPIKLCATVACTAITDPHVATGVQPATCKLYDGGVFVVQSAVAGPGGALYCSFTRTYAVGTHSITASFVASDGAESPQSDPFVFASSAGAPNKPVNLRIP